MPDLPADEILHESKGLTIKRNSKNHFVVATLFYWADPDKEDPKWAETVKAGMTPAQWAKEYTIDYTALRGERVFPELTEKKGLIVIEAPWPTFDNEAVFWGGFDYGQRNPSSFHVYAISDGITYAVWELYEPAESVPDFASKMRSCPYWGKIKYIAADPTIWDKRTSDANGVPASFTQLFAKYGITNFLKGNQNKDLWLATMYEHWRRPDPTFKILSRCKNMIREFEKAIFVDYSNEQMREEKNFKEDILDKDNHAMDDCKYFMNSSPQMPRHVRTVFDSKKMWKT